jgi:hypothetical protein
MKWNGETLAPTLQDKIHLMVKPGSSIKELQFLPFINKHNYFVLGSFSVDWEFTGAGEPPERKITLNKL